MLFLAFLRVLSVLRGDSRCCFCCAKVNKTSVVQNREQFLAAEIYEVLEHLAKPGRCLERYDNQICAVLLEGDSCLKRVQIRKAAKETVVILKGDRADYPTDTFLLGEREFRIQGVVIAIVERVLG